VAPVGASQAGLAGLDRVCFAVAQVERAWFDVAAATGVEASFYDLEGQEVLTLLAKHPSQALHVVVVELPVPRRGPLRIDQPLALQEADLRDGHVGELRLEQAEDIADGQVAPSAHLRHLPCPTATGVVMRRWQPGTPT
jgi:hypothetical protein